MKSNINDKSNQMIKLDEWVKHYTSLLVENREEFLQNNSQPNRTVTNTPGMEDFIYHFYIQER